MKKFDMSSEAITRRLRQVDQLRELCLSLMKAKKESDAQAKKLFETSKNKVEMSAAELKKVEFR